MYPERKAVSDAEQKGAFSRKRGIRARSYDVMQSIFDASEWMCKFGSTWTYDRLFWDRHPFPLSRQLCQK